MSIFALVDCNSFYASCERVFRPDLWQKPVIVLSNNDGCIVARSREVKSLGIPNGSPVFKVQGLLEKHRVSVFSSNYMLYGDLSRRVMRTLATFTPDIEFYSIDEAFLIFSEMSSAAALTLGQRIKHTVEQWTGVPVSVGLARTKTLAKVANHIAKDRAADNGVHCLLDDAAITPALQDLPAHKIWGIGSRLALRLNSYGIRTAGQLVRAPDTFLRRQLAVTGLRTVFELRGISCLPLQDVIPRKQAITSSRSFGHPLTELGDLKEAIASLVTIAGSKLRHEGCAAAQLLVFISTNPFSSLEPYYMDFRTIALPQPTTATNLLIHTAAHGLHSIYRRGHHYAKGGVMLLGLVPAETVQANLFVPQANIARHETLMKACDLINDTWGRDTVRFAATGIRKHWTPQHKFRSPCYTTNWEEIPVVRS